ncbi:glucosamine--fructose-6-phosphate aminotransferase (isomerizing) [Faunimonas pinastri]|uniref:Glucosamine--fructose-6-phosphate aminotransferase (Isomerizing) n=1 Tax=Faunimonas pinastri TaxID=1855383 RepID=A0A1H9AB77_9HYPH|nr:SIS domain-containing protein [Faunimonas pinastri]SEP74012.1 glucosamine--fructose-6-phosphate aminotransferase (isomerizing) [Faunimonas pinastri]
MSAPETTRMRLEIDEAPEAVRRLLSQSTEAIEATGAALRRLDPPVVITVARGSSDHAATFFKYVCEISRGTPVASIGPSVASVYDAPLRLAGAAALAISQSGKSPDLLSLVARAAAGGADTVALVNVEDSPLATSCSQVVPLRAGPELSVAATKSFITSAVAALAVLAAWNEDEVLKAALQHLPDALDEALSCDWSGALETFVAAESLYVLGRGPSFAMASEAALKFKETAILHAEAYSGAEVQHGPVSLVDGSFPVLALIPQDAASEGMEKVVAELAARGAKVFAASARPGAGIRLPVASTGHPLTDPLATILSFYRFVEQVAVQRGFNPDKPRHLKKVTETL